MAMGSVTMGIMAERWRGRVMLWTVNWKSSPSSEAWACAVTELVASKLEDCSSSVGAGAAGALAANRVGEKEGLAAGGAPPPMAILLPAFSTPAPYICGRRLENK